MTVCLAVASLNALAQRKIQLTFTDGLKTEVNIIADNPVKMPRGNFAFLPIVISPFGGDRESGVAGPFSAGFCYTRWSTDRMKNYEGYLVYHPLDSRTTGGDTHIYLPHIATRFTYRLIFKDSQDTKSRRINFFTDNALNSQVKVIHTAKLDIPKRTSVALRAGINLKTNPKAVFRTGDPADPADQYDVDMAINAFPHIGISRIKTFYLAYESKDFGGKQQAYSVGEIYADLLVGGYSQAFGHAYRNPYRGFGVVSRYRSEAKRLPIGLRIGAETRFSTARRRVSGTMLGIEIGKNPGFAGSSFYIDFKMGKTFISKTNLR